MKSRLKIALHSFTLIELLIVMAIIAILTALTLGAAGAIQNKAARSRAGAEIQAMSTALESYKLDNGIYPDYTAINYTIVTPASYTTASTVLFTNLSGRQAYNSATLSGKVYMSFKNSQLNTTVSPNYVQDPFGYAYGYSTAPNIMNVGFFDLWSTSGKTDNLQASTNVWMNNWGANQ